LNLISAELGFSVDLDLIGHADFKNAVSFLLARQVFSLQLTPRISKIVLFRCEYLDWSADCP